MKKYAKHILILLIIAVVAVWGISANEGQDEQETIRIGFSGAFTGPIAWLGEKYMTGIAIAQKEINEAGGVDGKMIEIVIQDNMYTGPGGVEAFRALQLQDVDMIFTVGSAPTVSLSPLAEEAGVPLFLSAVFADVLSTNENAVSFYPTPEDDARATLKAMNANGVKTVAMTYINNEYGNANIDAFRLEAPKAGIEIIGEEPFVAGATDLGTPATKVSNMGADAIYVVDLNYIPMMEQLQIQRAGRDYQIYTNSIAVGSNSVFNSRETFEGVNVNLLPVAVEGSEERVAFQEKLGVNDPDDAITYEAVAYDALYALADVLRENPDASQFTQSFANHGIVEGLNGAYDLNQREVGMTLYPVVVKGGEFVGFVG